MKTFCNDNNDLCIVFSSCIWGANCYQNWAMFLIALRCKHCYYFPQFLRSDLLCRISTMNLTNDCKQLSFCISYFFRSEFLHPSNNRPCWVKHELLILLSLSGVRFFETVTILKISFKIIASANYSDSRFTLWINFKMAGLISTVFQLLYEKSVIVGNKYNFGFTHLVLMTLP